MFNPKGNNLLDEQMSVSGLEMNWLGAVVGAVGSIAGGIMGSQQAGKQNKANRTANRNRIKHEKNIARKTNDYNRKLDGADRANYYAMRDYSYQTSMQNWQRGREIQDFQYLNQLKQYQKSNAIGNAQLGLNAEAEMQGFEAEANAIQEAFIQQGFQQQQNASALKQAYFENRIGREEQGIKLLGIKSSQKFGQETIQSAMDQLMSQTALSKETAMVESLAAEGAVQASMQAGKSKAKAQQANRANLHRSLMALESELSGKYKQAAIQMAELNADSSLAEAGVGLNLDRLENAIQNAEGEAQANLEVMQANMASQIRTAEQNIKQISLERKTADVNTRAGMMLFPERLQYDPVPTMPPERVFVDRMEAIPGFVPPPHQQSTFAPLIKGIAGAGMAIAGADFSKGPFGN